MAPRRRGGPPEENVACSLKDALPAHHPLAFVLKALRIVILADDRLPCLLDLEKHRLAEFVRHQQDEAASPHASDTDHLEREILCREMTQQRAPVMGEGLRILFKH